MLNVSAPPTITWDFFKQKVSVVDDQEIDDILTVDQFSYEIRLSTSSANWGSNSFVGNIIDTGYVFSESQVFRIAKQALNRGWNYYGQLYIVDKYNNNSGWVVFSMKYNSLPDVISAGITPLQPKISDDLTLDYVLSDSDSDSTYVNIKWFKDGVQKPEFNDQQIILSDRISYNEEWYAEITPNDLKEYGNIYTTDTVTISSTLPVSSDLIMLPKYPNENDILKASYQYSGDLVENKSVVKWYVNNKLVQTVTGGKYARLELSIGDVVYYTLTPFDGTSFGSVVSSDSKTIRASSFVIENIFIDGELSIGDSGDASKPILASTTTPAVRWTIQEPKGIDTSRVKIRIGTSPDSNDIYEKTLYVNGKRGSYQIPPSVLEKGVDYYLSIAASNSSSFQNYEHRRIKIKGSYWANSANNAIGWTLEMAFKYPYPNSSTPVFDSSKYHVIKISDGTKYCDVRLYNTRIGFFSDDLTLSDDLTTSDISQDFDTITVSAKGNDVKIYLNRQLILDASNKLIGASSSRNLSVVAFGTMTMLYKSFSYSLTGQYDPTSGEDFVKHGYQKKISLREKDIIGLSRIKSLTNNTATGQDIIKYRTFFASNPFEDTINSSVFEVKSGTIQTLGATSATLTPVNAIGVSSNNKNIILSHSRGITIVQNSPIKYWDYSNIFDESFDWNNDFNFELVSNTKVNSAYRDSDGFIIMTTWNNFKANAPDAVLSNAPVWSAFTADMWANFTAQQWQLMA